jgi:hypothetical protein
VIAKKAEEEEKRLRFLRVNQALAQASFGEYHRLQYSQREILDACGDLGQFLSNGKMEVPLSDAVIQQAVAALVRAVSVFVSSRFSLRYLTL